MNLKLMTPTQLLEKAEMLQQEEIDLHKRLASCMADQNAIGHELVRRLNKEYAHKKATGELPEGKLFVPPRRAR